MTTQDPWPDEPDGDNRRRRDPSAGGEHDDGGDTQRIPLFSDFDQPIEFTEDEDKAIAGLATTASAAPVSFDSVDLLATREASKYVRSYLLPTEKFRGEWRRHWIMLAKKLSIGVAATFILGYLAGFFAKHNQATALAILVVVWLAVMSWVLWYVVEWYYDRFVLTNRRVMLVEGLVTRRVAMMPLPKVTDMKYTQSALGRILGYGTFVLESAGQEQALRTVDLLPNPTDLYLQVVEEIYEPDASEARRRPAKIDDDGA